MKRLIKKIISWELATLIINFAMCYVSVTLVFIGTIEIVAQSKGMIKEDLPFYHYFVMMVCLWLAAMSGKKFYTHIVKIKRGEFQR
jgi:hypothetical protein